MSSVLPGRWQWRRPRTAHDRVSHSGLTKAIVEDVLRSLFPGFQVSPGPDDSEDSEDFDGFQGFQADFCVERVKDNFVFRVPRKLSQSEKDDILRHRAHSPQRYSSGSLVGGPDADGLNIRSHDSYKVGIICALDVESDAIHAIMDEEHPSLDKLAGDGNTYVFGRIHQQHVVVACASTNMAGSATLVAKDMMRSFDIKAGFSVGLCDGVWSEETDIRLGDVIVSQPTMAHGGVVQWDFDAWLKHGTFRYTGMLNRPPVLLFEALRRLNTQHLRRGLDKVQPLTELLCRLPEWKNMTANRCNDKLFASDYRHVGGRGCGECDASRIITRSHVRLTEGPRIHYGNIASSFGVPQDAMGRDRLARDQDVISFETEAAGLMNTFPCVLIRGVSSYGDSHKNDTWQSYAAGAAACYTKDLIRCIGSHSNDFPGYLELDYSRHQTRFLQILGGGKSEEISCTMYTGSPLEETYHALSYSWGDHKSIDNIIVNRTVRQVTKSLKTALIELRRRSVVTVWIDALCIDQNNPNEKAYQLGQMDSIFHRASKVISWLGPAADSSDLAMQKLNNWKHPVHQREEQALLALFERPYWRRAWIIQEVAKASEVEVWCGSKRVKWENVLADISKFFTSTAIPQSLSVLQTFCDAERANRGGQSPMLLSSAMIRTMHTQATIPRDKIYALLNLSRDGRTIVPFPSYDTSDAEVFDNILRQMIITQGRLDLLFFAGSWKQDRLSPSWLPSWNERPRQSSSGEPLCTWLAECFSREPGTFDGNYVLWDQASDALIVDAKVIGTLRDASEAPAPIPNDHEQMLLVRNQKIVRSTSEHQNLGLSRVATVFVVCVRLLACYSALSVPLDLPFRADDIPALLHLWSGQRTSSGATSSKPRHPIYPMLSGWYRDHGWIEYQGVSLRNAVDHWTADDMYFAKDPRVTLLDMLENALFAMLSNNMKMRAGTGGLPVVIVPQDTKSGDCIVWIRQNSLLAVLRPEEGGEFSVVGEVVDATQRLWLNDCRNAHDATPWKQITLI